MKLKSLFLRGASLKNLHKFFIKIGILVLILFSLLVLISWCLDIGIFKHCCGLNQVSIKASKALGFILSGFALWLLQLQVVSRKNKNKTNWKLLPLPKFVFDFHQGLHFHTHILAKVALGLLIFFPSLTVSEYIENWHLGIDELLFSNASIGSITSYPGRMSFLTAVNFMLIGIAITLLNRQKPSRYDSYTQILSLSSMVIPLGFILGYAYNKVEMIDSVMPYFPSMYCYWALTFLLICISILWMDKDRGLMGVEMKRQRSREQGSRGEWGFHPVKSTFSTLLLSVKKSQHTYLVLCWLLPTIFIGAIAVWFIAQPQGLNYYNPTFAIGLFAFLIWEIVVVIEELTQEPDNTQQVLQVAQNQFPRIFYTNILGIVGGNIHGINPKSKSQNPKLNIHRINPKSKIQNPKLNEQFLQMTGDFPEELISGKITWMELTPTNDILQNQQSIAQAKTKSTCQSDEKQLLCKDDSLIPVLCDCGALSKVQPDITTCILDLSGRQQLKMASQQEKPKLKLLAELTKDINCCPNPVAMLENCFAKLAPEIGLDIYWNYLVENKSPVMHLTSYSGISPTLAQSIEYLKIDQSVYGDVAQSLSTIVLENVQQSTEPRTAFIRSVGIRAYYSQALTIQGKLLGTIVFASCSRSQFSESELLLMEAVIDRIAMSIEKTALTNALQKQAEQLRDTNRIRDEFLSILSHELRSPLQSILGWAQLLRSRTLNPTQVSKGIEAIERNAKTQTQIVEDLLDISRMIKGKLRLNIHTCDLVPILQTVLENVELAAEVKGIDFSYSIDWGQQHYGQQCQQKQISQKNQATKLLSPTYTNLQFLVCGDPERLQQIIWNLLSNAIKFTPNGGRVEIFLSRVTDKNQPADSPLSSYAQIQVKDTGIGIDSHLIPYVFDRFYQTDSSNTRLHGGMGLGLAIVHHLVDLHGGTIEVESPGVGKGAIFTVKLPLFDDMQLQPMKKKRK